MVDLAESEKMVKVLLGKYETKARELITCNEVITRVSCTLGLRGGEDVEASAKRVIEANTRYAHQHHTSLGRDANRDDIKNRDDTIAILRMEAHSALTTLRNLHHGAVERNGVLGRSLEIAVKERDQAKQALETLRDDVRYALEK